MGLRDRLRRLEEAAETDTMTLVCPECGGEFRVHEDTGLDYIVWEWTQSTGDEGNWKAPQDLLRVLAHDHDASALVLKEDGSPWLGEFFHGIGQMPRDVEDLSE